MLISFAPARVAVAGVLPGVAGDLERLAHPAGGQHDRRGVEAHELTGGPAVAEGAGDPVAVLEQLGDRVLVEDREVGLVVAGAGEVLLLQRDDLLLQGADQLEARAVADVGQARELVAAEVPLADLALGRAVEQRPVGLELPDPLRRLLRVQLGHPPVVEELAPAHGVAEVDLPVVVRVRVAHRRRDPALGHDRVGLAEQRLADDGDPLAAEPGLDGGPQPGAPGPDDEHVVGVVGDRGLGRRARLVGHGVLRHRPLGPGHPLDARHGGLLSLPVRLALRVALRRAHQFTIRRSSMVPLATRQM
jgi:hypothetical protein